MASGIKGHIPSPPPALPDAGAGVLIGYARVSTEDQKLDLQRDALGQLGCHRVFKDRASGARADRPELAAALSHLRRGDTLVVWRLDRLGLEQFEREGGQASLSSGRDRPYLGHGKSHASDRCHLR